MRRLRNRPGVERASRPVIRAGPPGVRGSKKPTSSVRSEPVVPTRSGGTQAGDATRVVSLLQRLTDVPRERAFAVMERLQPAERDRLESLAAEILQDHRDLSGR
jgi:hypothetical protein